MPSPLDVFIIGEATDLPAEAGNPDSTLPMRLVPTGMRTLGEFAGTPWVKQLLEGESELAALIFGNVSESLSELRMLGGMELDAKFAATVTVDGVDGAGSTIDLTHGFAIGHGIRCLLAPRAGHGPIVFRRKKLKQVGPLRSVAEPVWDWIIRAVRAGEKIKSSPISAGVKATACRLPLLAPPHPGRETGWLREHLQAFSPGDFGLNPTSKVSETALRAGLFQWHDFLDESHQLSQSIEGEGEDRLGDYWHAIMHRREPDYSNAKYWFLQIGKQPIFSSLRKEADETLAKLTDPEAARWRDRLQPGSKWDPFAFVDLCEVCADDETTDLAYAARRIQYIEMSLLMGVTCRQCGGDDETVGLALAAKRA
jgi:hypothetical protein